MLIRFSHRMHILLLLIAYDKKNETHSDAGASPCVSFMLIVYAVEAEAAKPHAAAKDSKLLLKQCHGVLGNHQLLVGRDDANRYLRLWSRDDSLFAAHLVSLGIHLYAEELKT